VIEVIPIAIAATAALSLPASLVAHRTGWRSAAHAMNGVALAIACTGSLMALAQSGAANANPGGLSTLGALMALMAICFYNTRKPAMPSLVFWLAWVVNLAIVGALMYPLIWFKIF